MNPLAHYIVDIGCLEKKLDYLNKDEARDLINGSILPDLFLAGVFLKVIRRPFYSVKETHDCGKNIYRNNKAFVIEHSLEPVILGMLIHNEVDFLTHKEYKGSVGYIYQLSECIIEKVAKFYNIEKYHSDKNTNKLPVGKDLAHYIAEGAIDQLIVKNNKKAVKDLAKKIKSFTIQANFTAEAIDTYYNYQRNYLMNGFALHAFMGFVRFTMKPFLAKLTFGLSYHVGYGHLAGFKTLQGWFNEIQERASQVEYSYEVFLDDSINYVNNKLTGENIIKDIESLL